MRRRFIKSCCRSWSDFIQSSGLDVSVDELAKDVDSLTEAQKDEENPVYEDQDDHDSNCTAYCSLTILRVHSGKANQLEPHATGYEDLV